MNFEKDIFISYAHIDDQPMSEGLKGWISEFHKALEVRVSQLMGSSPVIWRDAKLQGNDFFAPEIVSQFPKLKVMISIITPRYVKSEWCTKEVDEFFKAAKENGGISIENKARIFKILKTPVDRHDLPEQIREILGYEFYRKDSATGRYKEFDRIFGQEIEQAYWAKLDDVAHDVAQLIVKLSSSATQSANGSTPEAKPASITGTTSSNGSEATRRKIFLADTTYDLTEYHESLKRELEDSGFIVFPNKNLTLVAGIFKNEVEAFMNDSTLSIHLVGSSYGLVPEGTDKSIIVLQNEIAAKQSAARGLNRLIWIPPNINPDDARQQGFIDQLKHSEELQKDSDLLEGTLEEFKFAIFDNIRKQDAIEKEKALEKEKQKESNTGDAVSPGSESTPRLVYLVCDQRDLNETKSIEDFLFDQGHEVMLPIFEGEESQLRKEHEENLRECDALILYYGNANELWVRSMTRDLLRLPALGRSKPLMSKIAYVANPSSPQKERFRSNELTVVNGLTGFSPQLLNDFMAKLK